MLKPLLRTIPTLSGNVKLACTLKDYERISNTDYSCYVRYARLLPLSSNLSQKNIETNLLYSSYDFDLQRFYKTYSNYFYDYTYEYDKKNYILIDETTCQKNRNTDFEFGCKRVSYKKNGNQYAFFVPIYIESYEDIPDYFLIHIILKNNKYEIERNIKVNISSKLNKNYLQVYLKNYLTKIDSNVIFCNSKSNQATYYGIDLVNGGTKKVVDNIIAKTFAKQNTINNFDAIITNGFKRNQIAIRQILPLCWYFNINDILTADEKNNFKNSEVYINGSWYKNGEELHFYDIDMNYQYYYENPYLINKNNGIFSYKNTMNNIMNVDYPSLNESMFIGYRYSNKLDKKYNRWKLKYSEDEHPYITNLSPAFSINQGSLYKYGLFPEKYTSINLFVDDKNLIIPVGNALKNEDSPYYSDYTLTSNYYKILNNNVANWYTLRDNLDDIYEDDIWKDTLDNKVYYKGILYDFQKIYDEYPKLFDVIDKFSVILNLHFSPIQSNELDKIKRASSVILNSDKYVTNKNASINSEVSYVMNVGGFNTLSNFYNVTNYYKNFNSEIRFDKLFIEDSNGDFIDASTTGYDINLLNRYYKYADIITTFENNESFYDNIYDILNNYKSSSFWINGYQLLDVSYLNNVLHENDRDIIFENKDTKWLLNHIYFSQHGNQYKTIYDRDTVSKLIELYGGHKNLIPLYIDSKFISYYNLVQIIKETYDKTNSSNDIISIINDIPVYEYYPTINDDNDTEFAANVFIKKDENKNNDTIYVDTYNLRNVLDDYNNRFNTSIDINFEKTESFYAKFLNDKHLLYYISDLYKNDVAEEDILRLYKSLFIRQRIFIGNPEFLDINTYDQYIHISKLYDTYRPLTKEEKIDILNGLKIFNHRGIYIKTKNQYSLSTYKNINCGDSFINNDGEYCLSMYTNEFHDEDYYYIPDIYIKVKETADSDSYIYIPIVDYIKDNIAEYDSILAQYVNKDIVSKLEQYDVDDLDLEDQSFLNMKIGINEIYNKKSKVHDYLYESLKTLQTYIRRVNNIIKGYTYYKVYGSDEYRLINNYMGINSYVLLDDIDIKKEIINGELDLLTYVIDESGNFVHKDYNEEVYTNRNIYDDDYISFIKELISSFGSDVEFYADNNYYKFTKSYLYKNDIDSIIQIPEYNTEFNSKFTFEIVYKKDDFIKLTDEVFNLINLNDESRPYKDLYLYKIYHKDDFPSTLRVSYYDEDPLNGTLCNLEQCLYPLFDDIVLQDKKYTVIYSEYNQANIYKDSSSYKYNLSNIQCMYDISANPYNMEYVSSYGKYYTPAYFNELRTSNSQALIGHTPLKTYRMVDSCYVLNDCVSDDLGIYEKYNINTYIYETKYTYSYTYVTPEIEVVNNNNSSYTVINNVERTGIGYGISYTTYGFILLDSYIDNTSVSFNIVDKKYKEVKYFSYINEHNIYDDNFNILDSFNLILPGLKSNMLETLFTLNSDVILTPNKYKIDTHYKQSPINDINGNAYAYSINLRNSQIDTFVLQRYFDSIVPYIKETNVLESTYCLKYKNYKYPNTDVDYQNDIFYADNINMYNYNKIRVYSPDNSYELYEPLEYKHLNDNKMINLKEEFEIAEYGTFTYEEIIEKEKDEYVLEKFKQYVLLDKLNTFNDNEILFLFNRYNVEYDAQCVGLNWAKTDKIYTLSYKFKLL